HLELGGARGRDRKADADRSQDRNYSAAHDGPLVTLGVIDCCRCLGAAKELPHTWKSLAKARLSRCWRSASPAHPARFCEASATVNLVLMAQAAEQPHQDNDRNRNADQPQQKGASHCCLQLTLCDVKTPEAGRGSGRIHPGR